MTVSVHVPRSNPVWLQFWEAGRSSSCTSSQPAHVCMYLVPPHSPFFTLPFFSSHSVSFGLCSCASAVLRIRPLKKTNCRPLTSRSSSTSAPPEAASRYLSYCYLIVTASFVPQLTHQSQSLCLFISTLNLSKQRGLLSAVPCFLIASPSLC